MRPLVLLALLVGALLVMVAPSARAETEPPVTGTVSWGLAPGNGDLGTDRSNFAYALDPGQEVADVLVVTNHADADLRLDAYAADAFTTTSGQLDLQPASEAPTGLGAWISLDQRALTVPAGATVEVPFTVRVPADASPGDHSAGLVTSVLREQSADTVAVDRRLALRMHVRVSGALAPALTMSAVDVVHHGTANPVGTSSVTIRYTLTNTGNARLVASETAEVAGPFGWATARTGAEELPELLPGSSIEREVVVDGVRPLGRAEAQVAVQATAVGIGGGATATGRATASTWAVPWALVVAVVVLGAALVLARRTLRALRARGWAFTSRSPGEPQGATPSSDALEAPAVAPGTVTEGAAPSEPGLTPDALAEALENARAEGRAQALAERERSGSADD